MLNQADPDQTVDKIGHVVVSGQLQELGTNTFVRYMFNQRGVLADCARRIVVDNVIEVYREAHCTNHAESIFLETFVRITDSADSSLLDIFNAAMEVDDFSVPVHAECVDSKVTASRIFFERTREGYVVWMTTVAIVAVDAEVRHFKVLCVPEYQQRSVFFAVVADRLEVSLQLFERQRRGDIDIMDIYCVITLLQASTVTCTADALRL